MNKTPTPRTDAAAWPETDLVEGNFARQLESELATVTEQLKAAHDGWHDEITKGLSGLRRAESIYTKAQKRAERAEEQRDRLAVALKDALYDLETSDGLMACDNEEGHSLFCLEQRSIPKARQALQYLNQNVKGDSHSPEN